MAYLYWPITWSNELGIRYGTPLWACGMIMLLSTLIYIFLKVVINMKMAFFTSLKVHNLVKRTRILWHTTIDCVLI